MEYVNYIELLKNTEEDYKVNAQYKVIVKDLIKGVYFKHYEKNDYFLRRFINKAKRSKKIGVIAVIDLYK